ncbi:hypothetical protein [Enterobacter roggenkampii]|uniref:hypothetical protein n=1 Tax=Enterobacter roggenkampii TaxID=1812935 RepID=UPI001F495659|nr:hypothetical protein [Enterobacter roggenkampii]
MQITKEQARKIIEAADEVITALAGTNEDVHPHNSTKMVRLYDDLNDHYAPPEVVRELARIALASLEAEAGEYQTHVIDDGCGEFSDRMNFSLPVGTKLYTTPPAPVSVPDDVMEAMQKVARIRLDLNDFDGDKRGILDCLSEAEEALIEVVNRRAAILQGADGNSPVIPDGWKLVPIEPTEKMVIEGFESEPDEFFSKSEVWEAYQKMSGCEQAAHRAKLCWAAMISAAPQQEVKL